MEQRSNPGLQGRPADLRRTLAVYNAFFPLVFLFLLPGFLVRMFRRGGFRNKFGQRVGLYSKADRALLSRSRPIWIHSISVGETLVALKLARQIHQLAPAKRIVLSTTTSTGFAVAEQAKCEWMDVCYNPVDFLPVVRRTLDVICPERLVLIEGEAWPNLLAECHSRGMPVYLANARLSPRSAARFLKFRTFTGPIFRLLDRIGVSDREEADRWERLGVSRDRLEITGNIKFDQSSAQEDRAAGFAALLKSIQIAESDRILLGGSTFEGEETLLAGIYCELRSQFPDLLLLIAPRHVERTQSILKDLAPFQLKICRRTELVAGSPQHERPDLLLIDTTGELRDWYRFATVVFIGKSLTSVGGQNPAEAIALGKPVLFGPHMENFAAITGHLTSIGGAVQVRTEAELREQIASLLSDPNLRSAIGARGADALRAHEGATEKTARMTLTG